MSDETAIIQVGGAGLAGVAALADEFARATRLTRYQEGLRDETIRRQKTDLLTFARFLSSIGIVAGGFFKHLHSLPGVGAGLREAFIALQKHQGHLNRTNNMRVATAQGH